MRAHRGREPEIEGNRAELRRADWRQTLCVGDWNWMLRADGVVSTMTRRLTRNTLLFNVGKFAACRKLSIPANHAPTPERSKPEEPYQTHGPFLLCTNEAIGVPSCADSARCGGTPGWTY